MYNSIKEYFTCHPKENNLTYSQHFCRAVRLSMKMGYSSVVLMIHSVFPFLFKETATTIAVGVCKELINKN